jgi:hypothetical protein
LGLRVGLPWRTQLDLVVPYSGEKQRTVLAGVSDERETASGFGGLGFALTTQLLTDSPRRLEQRCR